MLNSKKKMNLNIHMYIFIIIASIAIINDNIIYFSNLSYEISLLISAILIIIPAIYLIKKKIIEIKTDFSKWDLIAIVTYIIIYFIIIIHIDDFIDTISYHLYNQKNPFIDRINFDLLPSSTFFFPLGDRMNYIFVRFLGYRLGNLLYLYSTIVIFYQIKRFLSAIIPQIKDKLKITFSSIILYTFSVNLCIGEYSIDIFSSVILLELFYIAIKNINVLENKKYLYWSAFLVGISIGIKISNIIFASIILIYIIFKSYKCLKNVKIYDIVVCIILFIIPFGIYMINNYIQTQNPIFPFYNSIFQSSYYEENSAKDVRLGVKNIIETFTWPIIISINPLRGDDIRGLVDPVWGIGFAILIYCLIRNKKYKDILNITILSMVITVSWIIFASGYIRYGMFIPIIYILIEIYVLYKAINEIYIIYKSIIGDKKEKNSILKLILNFVLIFAILIQLMFSVFLGAVYILDKIEVSIKDFSYNAEENTVSEKYNIDGVWIASRYNTSCIDLIRNEEDPMYNADIITEKDPMMNVKSNYSEVSKKMFYEKIKGENLYTVINEKYFEYCILLFKNCGFDSKRTCDIYYNSKIQNANNLWYIIELKYIGK